jgi:hypothetical protein
MTRLWVAAEPSVKQLVDALGLATDEAKAAFNAVLTANIVINGARNSG